MKREARRNDDDTLACIFTYRPDVHEWYRKRVWWCRIIQLIIYMSLIVYTGHMSRLSITHSLNNLVGGKPSNMVDMVLIALLSILAGYASAIITIGFATICLYVIITPFYKSHLRRHICRKFYQGATRDMVEQGLANAGLHCSAMSGDDLTVTVE